MEILCILDLMSDLFVQGSRFGKIVEPFEMMEEGTTFSFPVDEAHTSLVS